MNSIHNTYNYFLDPNHRITVMLVGVGGTGSRVLAELARINGTLEAMNHMGLYVEAVDFDVVTEANCERQMFNHEDIGINKAVAAVSRINHFFGNDWEAYNKMSDTSLAPNIIISCVDTIKARKEVKKRYEKRLYGGTKNYQGANGTYYWIDTGNNLDTGQVVLNCADPDFKDVFELFPNMVNQNETDVPSCSLVDAINKQDLMINTTVANYAGIMLWKLFREAGISYNATLIDNRIPTIKNIPICRKEQKNT